MEERKINLLNKEFKFIKGVGVELEGGWIEQPKFKLVSDGSVSCDANYKGELHTVPKSNYLDIFKELKEKYPNISNESCGMHVHISLSELYYSHLMNDSFHKEFLSGMNRIEEYLKAVEKKTKNCEEDLKRFKNRLSGLVSYCKKEFIPDKQWYHKQKASNRYTMLNYCYGVHQTMECRLFPMFMEISNAKMAIVEYISIVEKFLESHKEESEYGFTVDIPKKVVEMPKNEESIF